MKSSFKHVFVSVYLLKITVILQFSLHVTPHGDIFCIIVSHWSHGATQSPSWFWIFSKVFYLCIVQREGGDHFFEFLKILANKQLQEDNFEVHEVISSLMY